MTRKRKRAPNGARVLTRLVTGPLAEGAPAEYRKRLLEIYETPTFADPVREQAKNMLVVILTRRPGDKYYKPLRKRRDPEVMAGSIEDFQRQLDRGANIWP